RRELLDRRLLCPPRKREKASLPKTRRHLQRKLQSRSQKSRNIRLRLQLRRSVINRWLRKSRPQRRKRSRRRGKSLVSVSCAVKSSSDRLIEVFAFVLDSGLRSSSIGASTIICSLRAFHGASTEDIRAGTTPITRIHRICIHLHQWNPRSIQPFTSRTRNSRESSTACAKK